MCPTPYRTISNTFNKRNPNIILITQTGDLNSHLVTKILQLVAKRRPNDFFNISNPAFSCKMVAIKKIKPWKGGHFMKYYTKGSCTERHIFNTSLYYFKFTHLCRVSKWREGQKARQVMPPLVLLIKFVLLLIIIFKNTITLFSFRNMFRCFKHDHQIYKIVRIYN